MPRQSGFALVISLSVMSLLLLVLLALTAFVRVEIGSMAQEQQRLAARANAQLGIQLALGRLQALAGPDTRTTATADLLRGDEGNIYRPDLTRDESTRNWVGVWDSEGYDEYDPTVKPFLGWLVSGLEEEEVEAAGSAPTGPLIPILSDNRVVETDVVEVPVVDLPELDGEQGRYAYWVSDEGVKARFDLRDPFRGSDDPRERQYSFRTGQRHAAEMITYDSEGERTLEEDGLYLAGDSDFEDRLDRLISADSLPLMGPTGSAAEAAYRDLLRLRTHDLTIHSEGLLTDSRRGGFKRDLSLAFEMPLDDFNASEFGGGSPDAELPVYRPDGYPDDQEITPIFTISDFAPFGFQPENSPNETGSYAIPPKLRGANWHFFRNFYRLYKSSDPDRTTYDLPAQNFTVSGGDRVYRGVGLWPRPQGYDHLRRFGQDANVWTYAFSWNGNVWEVGRPIIPAVSPIPLRIQTVMSIKSVPSTIIPGDWVLELYLDPVVTIMNPYNVPLATGEPNGQPLQMSINYQDVGFEIEVRYQEPDDTITTLNREKTLGDILNTASSGYSVYNDEAYLMNLVVPPGFVMEPGEVVIFSGSGEKVLYERDEDGNNDSGVRLVLEPGITTSLNTGSGVYFEDMWWEEEEGDKLKLPANAEMRIRFYVPDEDETKFMVHGRNRTEGASADADPFFSNFIANARSVPTGWSEWQPLNNPGLTGEKRPLVIYEAALKTETSPDPINLLSHFNVRANSYQQGSNWDMESQAYIEDGDGGKEDLFWGEWVRVDSWDGTWLSNNGRNGYWGGSNEASGGQSFVTLFEVPEAPVLSIGSLQHVQSTYMPDDPSMVIGNSFTHHFVHPDNALDLQELNEDNIMMGKTGAPDNRSEWTMTRVDWSYLFNQALWDGYFFSGITPEESSSQDAVDRFVTFQAGSPLPQSSLSYTPLGGSGAAQVRESLFDGANIRQEAPDRSAAHMRVRGMFNVNSTSVEAWKALLASSRNASLEVKGSAAVTPEGTPFTRTLLPDNEQNQVWQGFRNLTDSQLTALAEEIVQQVQIRGPFLNLSDFVNRRLRPSNHPSQQMGPLQAAIDAADLNDHVTRTLADEGMVAADLNPFVRDRIDPDTPVAMGATGFLTQADLLTVIGPLLHNRSDTFVIRSFGETGNTASTNIAQAWCEAVVQRVPYESDPLGADPEFIPDQRRFEVVSFRWLAADEI